MKEQNTRARRILAAALMCSSAALLAACGGQMPFSGNVNVAGDPPPLPAPPPPPKPKPEPPKRVEIRDNKIEILEKIQFEYNKSDIKEESFSLMDEITKVFSDNPHIKKVNIEGHTDSDGADAYNLKLSDARAKAVMKYIVDHGVDASRMTAKGFGEAKPIADNGTDEGKATNRRVEFNIVEQDVTKKKVEIDPKTGKEKVVEEKKATEKKPEADDKKSDDKKSDDKKSDDKKSDKKSDEKKPAISKPAK